MPNSLDHGFRVRNTQISPQFTQSVSGSEGGNEAEVAKREELRRSKREVQPQIEARHHELCDQADESEQRVNAREGADGGDGSRRRIEGITSDGSTLRAISVLARKAQHKGALRELSSSNRLDRGSDALLTVDNVSKRCGRVQATRSFARFSRVLATPSGRGTLAAGAVRVAWEFFSTEIRIRAEREARTLNRML